MLVSVKPEEKTHIRSANPSVFLVFLLISRLIGGGSAGHAAHQIRPSVVLSPPPRPTNYPLEFK